MHIRNSIGAITIIEYFVGSAFSTSALYHPEPKNIIAIPASPMKKNSPTVTVNMRFICFSFPFALDSAIIIETATGSPAVEII